MKKDLEFKILSSIAFLSPFLMFGEKLMQNMGGTDTSAIEVYGYEMITLPMVIVVILFLLLVWSNFFSKKVVMSIGTLASFLVIMSFLQQTYENNLKYIMRLNFTLIIKQIEINFFESFFISLCLFMLVFIGFLLGAIYLKKSEKTIDM